MYNNYSPNMLKTYKACPKKFYYQYIEKISMPKSSLPFEKGKKIHALANYSLQKIKIDRLETALTKEEAMIWQKLLNNPYYNKDCLKSEFPLMIKLDKYWVGGRIDAVVFEGDNYYILDYKTGSAPKNAQYDFQTMIYLLCMDKYLKNYSELSFVYIDLKNDKIPRKIARPKSPKNNPNKNNLRFNKNNHIIINDNNIEKEENKNKENEVIKFNREKESEYETKIVEACQTIEKDTLYKCNPQNCNFCEYKKLCQN